MNESETKEKVGMGGIVKLQKQMNSLEVDQMKQQHEFFEKQNSKKINEYRSIAPKLDMVSFSGNKLKWTIWIVLKLQYAAIINCQILRS